MSDFDLLKKLPGALLPWFAENARPLPWRQDREPYHVWLSEIMLQQTRVEAVKDYYTRFLRCVPDIPALAAADSELLAKLWEGLGYYSRVRNLQTAAKQIMERHGGVFPSEHESIRALCGVGDYTAGAIASICFGAPTPAVDGNVLRTVARICSDARSVSEEKTKADYRASLREVYPAECCGDFTQALMELGATVCVPNGAPSCDRCPCRDFCRSSGGGWKVLPVKTAKKPRRREKRSVFVLRCGELTAVRKRGDAGLLAGLWEFPNVPGRLSAEEAVRQAEAWGVRPAELLHERAHTHIFTHIEWEMRCFYLSCRETPEGFVWVDDAALRDSVALPTAFRVFRE